MLHIKLLGTPEIYQDDELTLRFRTRKAQALLIYLAVTARNWSRDALATLFWPETDDATARKNLRDILPPLRRQLDDYLLLDDNVIGLNPASPTKCDVTHFSRVLEQPLQKVETETLAATLSLYRGEFLEGYTGERISADFELWTLRERERLHQLALMGFTTLCRRQQEEGAYEAALVTIRQLLKLAPWDEAAHRQQMLLLAQSGQRAAALAHFESCRQLLADELDVEPDEETVQLYEQIKAGRVVAQPAPVMEPPLPPAAKAQAILHNLPRQLTSLIGRAGDIETVAGLLAEENTAVLTLVGQGGVGKTRLALAVAQRLRQNSSQLFSDGIWFVALAGIGAGENATEQIAGTIAQALGLSLSGSEPLSKQILRALAGQQMLLILDNFEHLVGEQAFLLEVVQTAHQVKLLVTSREQLRLHAEHLYPVVGLPVPAADEVDAEAEPMPFSTIPQAQQPRLRLPVAIGQYPGVQLFVARTQQRLPEFQLTPKNQANIGRICRLLGGVPLGIELAAQLYVEQGAGILPQLMAEIEQLDPLERPAPGATYGLDHLQTPAIDLLPRQRSIHAVFVHSWRLLTRAEQDLLRHCAIFRGGFTREAILAVGNGDGATLLALVTKSLVRRDSHERYDLHELIRQYVIDQFQQDDSVVQGVAQKHATYFAELMAGQEETLLQQLDFHQMLQTEIYNIRASWYWLTTPQRMDQAQIALLKRSVTCLFQFLFLTGQRQEALSLAQPAIASLQHALSATQSNPQARRLLGHLLANAAEAGVRTEERDTVKRWLSEAKAIGEEFADADLLSQVYITSAVFDASGSSAQIDLFDLALRWAERAASPFRKADVILNAVPRWIMYVETRDKATARYEDLVQIIQTHGYRYLMGDMLLTQALVYKAYEEFERAIETIHKSLEACQNGQGSRLVIRLAHEVLGQLYLQSGNFSEAQRWALAAFQQSTIHGNQLSILNNLLTLSQVRIQLQDWAAAEDYLRELVLKAERLSAMNFATFGNMGFGRLYNLQGRYAEGMLYYQKAAELAVQANNPRNRAVSLGGIAHAYLAQGRFAEAYKTIEPLLANDALFSLHKRDSINLVSTVYQVLREGQESRAAEILERGHTLVQAELAKIKDARLRTAYLANDESAQNIVRWWEAQHGRGNTGKKVRMS